MTFLTPKHFFVLSMIIGAGFLFSACLPTSQPATSETTSQIEKTGFTTKTGTIVGNQGAFVLQVPGEPPLSIESYSVELSEYVGQEVTVTGQYSGDTLFVGEIQ